MLSGQGGQPDWSNLDSGIGRNRQKEAQITILYQIVAVDALPAMFPSHNKCQIGLFYVNRRQSAELESQPACVAEEKQTTQKPLTKEALVLQSWDQGENKADPGGPFACLSAEITFTRELLKRDLPRGGA